jgi:branched-chain amino acid transport system permease protein
VTAEITERPVQPTPPAAGRQRPWGRVVVGLVLTAVILLLPAWLSTQWMSIAVQAQLLALGTLALTLLAGYGGQFSIASAGLYAVGAAALGALQLQAGLPTLVGLAGATAAGALVGLAVGLPALRLRGLYLLLATLAVHFIALYFFRRYVSGSYGPIGLLYDPLTIGGIAFNKDSAWFYLLVPVIALVALFVRNVRHTGVGRSLLAIKQNEVAAAASGIDVVHTKLAAFVFSSALTSLAGALYGLYLLTIAADYFTLQMAINLYVALIVGGQLSAGGAIIGSIFVSAGPTLVANLSSRTDSGWLSAHAGEVTNMAFGIAIIVVLMVQPNGLWGIVDWCARKLRRRGRPAKEAA